MSHADCTCGGVPCGRTRATRRGPRIDKRRNAVSPSHLPVTLPWTLNNLGVRTKDWAIPLSSTPPAFWCSAFTEQATVQCLTQDRHRVLDRLAGRKPNGSSRPVSPRQGEFNIGARHQGNKPRRAWEGIDAAPLAAVTRANSLWLSLRENPRQTWVHREPTVHRCHERHVDNRPQGGTCISGNSVCLVTQRRPPPSMRGMSLPST